MLKFYVIFVLLLCWGTTFAQQKKFFDSPFGAGGGYIPSWVVPNYSDINPKLKGFGIDNLSKTGFYVGGGSGYVYIGFIQGLRIGGIGVGGSTKQSSLVNGFKNEILYSSNFGGLTVEYTLPYFRDFGVSLGLILGAGMTSIDISRSQDNADWNAIWTEISDPTAKASSFSRKLQNNYFLITPTLNIDVPVHRLIALRFGAGYSLPFGENWRMDNDREILNVPGSVKGGGLFITSGIFFGFFSY